MQKKDGETRCIDASDRIKHLKPSGWSDDEINNLNKDCKGCVYSDGKWHPQDY